MIKIEIDEEISVYTWRKVREIRDSTGLGLEEIVKTNPLIKGLRSFIVAAAAARRLRNLGY